jgi:hypothetical protein
LKQLAAAERPVVPEYVPAGQFRQFETAERPVVPEYVPAGQ